MSAWDQFWKFHQGVLEPKYKYYMMNNVVKNEYDQLFSVTIPFPDKLMSATIWTLHIPVNDTVLQSHYICKGHICMYTKRFLFNPTPYPKHPMVKHREFVE